MIKSRRAKPRKGRLYDPDYLAWIAQQPCLVTGHVHGVTVHHVRRDGEGKNDRRTVPLVASLHIIQFDPKQNQSIEALGKKKFQALHGVDLEAAIVFYNAAYEGQV